MSDDTKSDAAKGPPERMYRKEYSLDEVATHADDILASAQVLGCVEVLNAAGEVVLVVSALQAGLWEEGD